MKPQTSRYAAGAAEHPRPSNRLDRFFIWLSGASPDILACCPESEYNKQAALGGAVLIPALMAVGTASFLLHTLNFSPYVIAPVALLWACIILLMDRAILATYRKSFSIWGKLAQFSFRFIIAFIVAITVAHPVVLMLFSERIDAAYNEGRIKTEREQLALQCDLKNPGSDLRLLDAKITQQRNELKNQPTLFEPPACTVEPAVANVEPAPSAEHLTQEITTLKAKQAQAEQDVVVFTQNAEKEKQGVGSDGFTGVRGCLKGTQCKRWLSQASDRKDDSIRIGKAIVALEQQITDLNEKMASQVLESKQARQKRCDKEREELKTVRAKQHALDQQSLSLLNDQQEQLLRRCTERDAIITHLKPDILTQTELLTQLIFPNHTIAWHNLLIFLAFMLLFLAIDLLAVMLKMTNTGFYETQVAQAEQHNQLLETIRQQQQVLALIEGPSANQ